MSVAILDGNYLLHRVMHVPTLRQLSTKDGKPTGGTFGLIKSLRSTLWSWPDVSRVIVVFDGGRSRRRMQLFPGYKDRPRIEDVDPDGISYMDKFWMQLRQLNFILPRLGVKVVKLRKREADDVVGLLCRELPDKLKIVSSDDKDMLQLISSDVHVWRPIAEERVTLDNFEEMTGVPKGQWLARKSVLGDGADKIPGVPSVGKKTIDEILSLCPLELDYPFMELFDAALALGSKRALALVDSLDVVLRNAELIEISREEFAQEEVEYALSRANEPSDFDILAVKRVFTAFEFFSLIEDFSSWVVKFQLLR